VSYSDRQLLADIQRLRIEPTVDDGLSWVSGLWTLTEVLGYANQRQQNFLALSAITGGWFDQVAPAAEVQTLDDELVLVGHAIYEDANAVCSPLNPLSRFSADLSLGPWIGTTQLRPYGYLFEQTGTGTISLVPPPSGVGRLHLFGVVLADILDRSGVLLNVPDEWVPYVRFGILADMLGKQGEAYDAPRAEYCEQRYQEGIDAAKAVLEAMI
jgi:hypothetical protein